MVFYWLMSARRTAASGPALARLFSRVVIVLALGGLIASTLAHELRVLETSVHGPAYPSSIYQPMPVPGTSKTAGSGDAAGADFIQVYTSGLALRNGQSAYSPRDPAYRDRFGRPPGYPPPMNWLYVPLTWLDYREAFLVHTLGTAGVLWGVSALLLWRMGLKRHIARVIGAQAALLFLTPIGFTHLERGQHDIAMTVSAALAVACSYWPGRARGLAVASGVLGSLKWTAPAFLGCFSALAFLTTTGRRRWLFFSIPVVFLLVTACFYGAVLEYWRTIQVYELDAQPYGLTLQNFLPRIPAKLVPILATLFIVALVWARRETRVRRDAAFGSIAVPFSIALMNSAICFGTLSYEYHTVATLGMIPGLIVWIERDAHAPVWAKLLAAVGYASFLIVAFRSYQPFLSLDPPTMTACYAACTVLFLIVCACVLLFGWRESTSSTPVAQA
jgi:hypothetical protein